jgi:hypothetical protein
VNWFAIALLNGVAALIVVAAFRMRSGLVAIPGIGRQPFIVVVLVCWALALLGSLLFGLARTPAGPTVVVLAATSGILQVLRGREIAAAGQLDPRGGRRRALVAAHAVLVVGVLVLMATGQL